MLSRYLNKLTTKVFNIVKVKKYQIFFLFFLLYFFEFLIFINESKKMRVNKYLEMEKKYLNISLSVYSRNFLKDQYGILPLSNLRNKKVIDYYGKKNFYIFDSDQYGFNNKNEDWEKDNINILIGDEFVLGSCINDVNFASLISKKFNILNLSNRGFGPLSKLATLKEFAPKHKTKKIIWFFNKQNDLLDLNLELENDILKKYLSAGFNQNLNFSNIVKKTEKIKYEKIKYEIDSYINNKNHLLTRLLTFAEIRNKIKLYFNFSYNHKRDLKEKIRINEYFEVIDRLINYSKINNIELVIILTPTNIYYTNKKRIFNSNFQKKFIEYFTYKKIYFIDIDNEIKKLKLKKKDIFYSNNPRSLLNETGHKIISDIVKLNLKK